MRTARRTLHRSTARSVRSMDGLKLLEKDHKLFRQLLAEGEETTERGVKTRTELFERLKRELTIHEQMEEEVLYPALRGGRQVARHRAGRLRGTPRRRRNLRRAGTDAAVRRDLGAKCKVAKENLEHHMDEEESEMWKAARQRVHRRRARDDGQPHARDQAGRRGVAAAGVASSDSSASREKPNSAPPSGRSAAHDPATHRLDHSLAHV